MTVHSCITITTPTSSAALVREPILSCINPCFTQLRYTDMTKRDIFSTVKMNVNI